MSKQRIRKKNEIKKYTVEILERAEAFSSYIDNAATNRTDVR